SIPVTVVFKEERPMDTKKTLWASRALKGIAVLFLIMDVSMKLFRLAPAVQGTVQLGYPESMILPLGIIELVCLIADLIPPTPPLGALIWTGYLGGAVATHVRIGDPLATHILFPIYVALFLWGGLWLRDARVRALLPIEVR